MASPCILLDIPLKIVNYSMTEHRDHGRYAYPVITDGLVLSTLPEDKGGIVPPNSSLGLSASSATSV
ncbi:hypothetical protein VTI28DRAFT_4427 [Corynascus sepedonium]